MNNSFRHLIVGLLTALALTGCGEEEPEGTPTESICPPGSTLTYETFTRTFAETYCTRCHSSTLTGDARMGAPEFHDFDSEQGMLNVAEHIDENAAGGPAAINRIMPPSEPLPTDEERHQLGEWLACQTQ